jgi:hypothetical protein
MSHLSATNDAADTSLTAVMMGEAAATPPETDAAPAAAAPQPLVAFAKKQRRGNMRKRAADDTEPAQLATVSEESDVVRKQKASRGDNPMAFSTKKATDEKLEPFTFDSSRTLQQSTDNRATATLETETAFDRDARCGMASCEDELLGNTPFATSDVLPKAAGGCACLSIFTDPRLATTAVVQGAAGAGAGAGDSRSGGAGGLGRVQGHQQLHRL